MADLELSGSPKMFGAYVENISSSIGRGGQGGTCQLTLVEDPEDNVVLNLPEVGTAAYFKYHGFYYGGIFQRWSYREAIDGRKYDVILESPGGKILDGVHVILSSFEGTGFNEGAGYDKIRPYNNPNFTAPINNVWNPFGHKENYSFGGRFGAADTNSAGFPALELLKLLELIARGESDFGGKIVYGESEYELDLSALYGLPQYFRIGGQSATLSAIIQECTELLQFDFIAEVVSKSNHPPTDDGGEVITDPVIKITTLDRSEQPSPDAVRQLVEQQKSSGKLISSDVGQELSDDTTQRIVIGGPASRYVLTHISDCYPIWGKFANGAYILGKISLQTLGAGILGPNVPQGYQLGAKLDVIIDEYNGTTYPATVAEVRMALGGYEAWQTFKVFESIANGTQDSDPWVAGLDVDIQQLALLASGQRGSMSLASTSIKSAQKAFDEEKQKYSKKIFDKVSKVANEFYGRYFLVPLPAEPGGISNNLKFVREDVQEISAWEIADTAWTTEKPISDIAFYNGDGRLKSVSLYPVGSQFDYAEMGSDYAIWDHRVTGTQLATHKSGPHEPSVFYIGGHPFIVVDTSVKIYEYDQFTTPDFGITFLAKYFFNVDIDPKRYISPGKQNTQIPVHPAITYPDWLAVPQESSRYSWGPWFDQAHDKGKAEVVVDTSLRPETFGSVTAMNLAGQDTANAGNSRLAASESGRVELAEFPNYSLGERFASSGPYISNMNITASTGGVTTNYEFNTWTPNFGKLTKYNADRISRIYKGTLGALQRIREDNPRRPFQPFTFQKTDFEKIAERLKTNRTSADFSLFSLFSNPHVEGTQCNLSDAAPLALEKLNESFGCSEDQKWTPAATRKSKTDDDLGVYFALPVELDEEADGKFAQGVGLSSRDLDPYFSETVFGDAATMIQNVDFMAAVNAESGETTDLALRKAGNVDEIRSVGLRGPLIIGGWGFDIAGNPVPAKDDDITKFDTDNFLRQNMKTGPFAALWDKERKTWVGGLEFLSGILDTDITPANSPTEPTTFTVRVLRKTADAKGAGALSESGETITCYNRDSSLRQSADGTPVFVIVIRINYEWTPIWVGCP